MYPALQSCILAGDQNSGYNNTMYQHQPYSDYGAVYYEQRYYSQQPNESLPQPQQQYNYQHPTYPSYQQAVYQQTICHPATYQHTAYPTGQSVSLVEHQISQPVQIQDPSAYSTSDSSVISSSRSSPRPVKPPYSYAALMCMAINSTAEKKATMREILTYIEQNFPYYRSNKKWHGTIRHDLTVNDCFVKSEPRPGQKGCLWSVHPEFQDMFSKTSFCRRRYRFKEGSTSWRQARKETAAKTRRKMKGAVSDDTASSMANMSSQNITNTSESTIFANALVLCDSYSSPEISSPVISSSEISSPEISSPVISSAEISSPDISSLDISSLDISSPEISSPEISSPEISSPEISSPEISSPVISSPEISSGYGSHTDSFSSYNGTTAKHDTTLDDLLSSIPSFNDCVDDLYQSFQTDFYNSVWIMLVVYMYICIPKWCYLIN